jgi:hypothetical protein
MELSAELREVALEAQALAGETTVNGHANGDEQIQVEDPAGGADPVASGSTLPALTETLSSINPTTLPQTIPNSTATSIIADPPTTWQAHNLDIDLISLKLSKHKYLTPSDFLADIAKIEENAEKLMDPDRITKIGEMGAHARMHVLNFDPAWEPRFEAYAERVRGRKAKRAEERERKAAALAGADVVEGGDAVVEGGEGQQEGEGSLKRARDEDGVEGEERGDKRQKEDIVMDEPTQSIEPIAEEPTVPPPRPIYPPFILPQSSLSNLQSTLTHATSSFNIEQLEQLRATCFDTIWKYRAEWDRTSCLGEVGKVVDAFVGEVADLNENGEEEGDYGV